MMPDRVNGFGLMKIAGIALALVLIYVGLQWGETISHEIPWFAKLSLSD